jgi:hypothetical protein
LIGICRWQVDAEASAVPARIEAATGMTPRAFFTRILRHPDIDCLAEDWCGTSSPPAS